MDLRKEPRIPENSFGIAIDKEKNLYYDVMMVNISTSGAGFYMWSDIFHQSNLQVGTVLNVTYKNITIDCQICWYKTTQDNVVLVGCSCI